MRTAVLILLMLILGSSALFADEQQMAVTVYGGRMTVNDWGDFFTTQPVDWRDSYLAALSLSRRVATWQQRLDYEIEGQVVKHFNLQNHWEFNLLGVLRWQDFFWDHWLETSAAFGLGPSWASQKPDIEIENDGETGRFLVYWMLELAVTPIRDLPEVEIVSRIHHRSDAFGLIADDGGSNALALGLRYRF